jgi:benzoate-CoA ligase family protein
MHRRFNASEWLVDRHMEEGDGERLAIRYEGRSLTYADVHREIVRVAGSLRALGVRPEERVAMAMLDSPEFVAVFLGAMRIGAVPLPMNPMLPGRDLGVIASDSRARVAVVSGDRADSISALRAGAPELEAVIVTEGGTDAQATHTWEDFLSGTGDTSPYPTWAESPGFWLCTSGSTGHPKLAMHRHGDLLVTHETYAKHVLDITADDRCYSVGPMFHAYGLGNSLSFPFAVGATSILEAKRPPTPQRVAEIATVEEPTLFFCIPTFYAALNAAALPEDAFATVRLAVSAAEPLPAETSHRFKERYSVTVLDGIGSTEMLHIYLSNTPARLKPGTSGVPVAGYEVRVVDEAGADQGAGEPGQLLVRGDSAATGYWCRGETTRETFEGHWMRTGDLYCADDEGFYTYLGRADDMLRVGGEWVSPAEVEAVLIEHPEVLEAAVVGERDAKSIVRPVAYVIPADGIELDPEALTALCRERLAGYKRPRRFEIVSELPKTSTGKIQRYKLRDAMAATTGEDL